MDKISRRKFFLGLGLSAGTIISGTLAKPVQKAQALSGGLSSEGYKFRDRSKRYPWWVKTVDEPTVQIDWTAAKQPKGGINIAAVVGQEKYQEMVQQGLQASRDKIYNNVAGSTLKDFALHNAAGTYFTSSIGETGREDIWAGLSKYLISPQTLGVKKWEGSEAEASEIVEAAATFLGGWQVGFSAVQPLWLYANVSFSDTVTSPTIQDKKMIIPERYKYVVTFATPVPAAPMKRAATELSNAADRMAWSLGEITQLTVINFIKALGYDAMMLPGPWIPFGLMAGLGEMGRTNRLISPIFGGNVRLRSVLTDLPLAIDKPIDFGLQEFCKKCKKCASACPVGALSMADEPYWEPAGEWSAPGKKVYYEDCLKCRSYLATENTFCGVCMASCPWSKQNISSLHSIAGTLGGTMPSMANLLVQMDDSFGYGITKDPQEIEKWWKLDLPAFGIDTMQGKE